MKVLVTGYAGQLGWDTVHQLEARGIEARELACEERDGGAHGFGDVARQAAIDGSPGDPARIGGLDAPGTR